MQVPCHVELDRRDYAGNKLQKYEQGEVALHFLTVLSHRIWHALQHICVLTRVDCRHEDILKEREGLDGQSLVQILFLNIFLDCLIADWFSFDVSGTEEHSGSVIVLVIDYVHRVVPDILLFLLFLFFLWSM